MKINDKSQTKNYLPAENRYETMQYRRSGNSGVLLPAISLGLWHNFGFSDDLNKSRNILRTAFDLGITHFDLANNYGPPYGAAEENFGLLLQKDFYNYRDELFISTKAGYDMWPGPYGNWGSRKYLMSSIDQSLKRLHLDYVDVFYHHRFDPETPLEETMIALSDIVKQGKALYVGISNYDQQHTKEASAILKELQTPFIIHQARYSILDRWVEDGLLKTLEQEQVGLITFSPLAQGMLSDKYLDGIPANSRAAKKNTYLETDSVERQLEKISALNEIAAKRGQKLSQMAISWLLYKSVVSSVLVGVSSSEQLIENVQAVGNTEFTQEELAQIDAVCD